MRTRFQSAVGVVGLLSGPWGPVAIARDLSFEDRVLAQEAIERVRYAHQLGATRPFEEAVPRSLLESKVQASLLQSVALEQIWSIPLTSAMLQDESDRIAAETRMPERLIEIYDALGNDGFLYQETVVRAALVARLAREQFSGDRRIHPLPDGSAVAEREALEFVLTSPGTPDRTAFPPGTSVADGSPRRLDPAGFADMRDRLEALATPPGAWREQQDRFVRASSLATGGNRIRATLLSVPKRGWDEWFAGVAPGLEVSAVRAVAASDAALPAQGTRRPATSGADTPPCEPQDDWSGTSSSLHPAPGWSQGAVWTGVEMIVWGGNGALGEGARYDPALNGWSPISRVGAPAGRFEHATVWTGSKMIVWGGQGATGTSLGDGALYDPALDEWTPVSGAGAPSARQRHTAVWTGSMMIVWGGRSGPAGSALQSGAQYDPLSDAWSVVPATGAPVPRDDHSAAWTGSEMIVWGGYDSIWLLTGGRFNPTTGAWTPTNSTATNVPVARRRHTAVWTGTEMIVWGGSTLTGPLKGGSRYNPATDSWNPTNITLNVPEKREYHTAVWTGSEMLIWGGFNAAAGGALAAGARYSPSADSWTPLPAGANAPVARERHVAAWTGSEMLVWGGRNTGGAALNAGSRYKVSSNSWSAIPPVAGLPIVRWGHSLVWTGNVALSWAGETGSYQGPPHFYVNSGEQYDPTLDTWTPMSTAGAPAKRYLHAGVWSGDYMIVWGGASGSALNTGGRYDPVADLWSPMSTVSAPPVSWGACVAWSGTEMIVWGGFDFFNFLGSGGRYDPLADSWQQTSSAGAPSRRINHACTWTGSRFFVWGGQSGPTLGNGALYDPASDTWSAVTPIGAPGARLGPEAVWEGKRVLVWGGVRASVNDGGQYDPVANNWLPITASGAPSARYLHTPIWTGSEMIIWGGGYESSAIPATDGGHYDPATNTWRPTGTVGAPVPRHWARGVWTGDRVLYVGGLDEHTMTIVAAPGLYAPGAAFLDDDGDGFSECTGSVHDCNDADSGVFAAPGEVGDLMVSSPSSLAWSSAAPAAGVLTTHDLLRGSVGEWPVGGGPSESCMIAGTTAAVASDVALPAPGTAFYYLVRARNSCGVGTYGFASSGAERTSAACP